MVFRSQAFSAIGVCKQRRVADLKHLENKISNPEGATGPPHMQAEQCRGYAMGDKAGKQIYWLVTADRSFIMITELRSAEDEIITGAAA
ncbi:hypothetical protein NDU88_010777 [Pleurodeles waltl]|uniref:Uncharacterized protein n=1 Tax=Pleurodeles waltl TaxID=8319 RepID=A0AAV7QVC7_PLEWA|nr:hypothetical protein NDU88_010777 [Pleurodeles waltl]